MSLASNFKFIIFFSSFLSYFFPINLLNLTCGSLFQVHENVKYLPGHPLPENVVADPDLVHSIEGSDLLVFVVPHQFLKRILNQIKPHMKSGARAISLMKVIVQILFFF